MTNSQLIKLVKEILNEDATSAPAPIKAPADVTALNKIQTTSPTITNKAKTINNRTEFPGAFENWFKVVQ